MIKELILTIIINFSINVKNDTLLIKQNINKEIKKTTEYIMDKKVLMITFTKKGGEIFAKKSKK